MHDKTNIKIDSFRFTHSYCGHDKTLFLYFSRFDKRKYYWVNKIVHFWNSLPQNVVNSASVSVFKSRITDIKFIDRWSIYCAAPLCIFFMCIYFYAVSNKLLNCYDHRCHTDVYTSLLNQQNVSILQP